MDIRNVDTVELAVSYWNSLTDNNKVSYLKIVEETLALPKNSEEAAVYAVSILAHRREAGTPLKAFVKDVCAEIAALRNVSEAGYVVESSE